MRKSELREEILIEPLATPAEWDGIRPEWAKLEEESPSPPWGGLPFAQLSWESCGKPETFSIILKQDGKPVAGCFLRAEFQRHIGLQIKTLRLYDDIFFMYMPFLTVHPDKSEAAVSMLFRHARMIRKKTRARMIYLRRIDEASYKSCLKCESLFLPMYGEVFTRAPQLRIKKDRGSEEALKELQPKRLKKLRHQQVRMQKLLGSGSVVTEHALHELMKQGDIEAVNTVLDAFFELRSRSWQHQWEEESPQVDHKIMLPFMRRSIALWAENYPVYIFFVMHEDRPIAFFLAAVWDDHCWGVFTGYDHDYHKFSVGQQAFLDGVSRLHTDEGIELFELGGEVIGWKEKWKTAEIPVHTAFCSLCPFALTANAMIWKHKLSKEEKKADSSSEE